MCCYFGKRGEKFIGKTIRGIPIGLDGWCENYNKITEKCDVYENRPQVCKDFEKGGQPCLTVRRVFEKLKRLNLINGLDVNKS